MRVNYPFISKPAHVVSVADLYLCNAVGFFCAFIRATGNNSLPPPLRACCVRTGAEEQFVCVVGGDSVEEPAQSLIAFRPVAQARLGSGFDTSRHILCAKLLAHVVHIASLGRVQAAIHSCHANV